MLRIGSSQTDITPPPPITMGGTFLKMECTEVHDPLMAGCVVADDGRSRVAIVSCDLGNLSRDLVLSIREKAAAATGISGANIHVTTTHNHSSPTVIPLRDLPFADADLRAKISRTRAYMVEKVAECVVRAHARLAPARMGYGRGRFEGGAFNRRFIMSNGRSRMHGGNGLERLRQEGAVDREVQAVWFVDVDGRPTTVMVNYSSHATNLYGRAVVSADFPGVMRDVLQGVLGKDVTVVYLQGACGNVMCDDLENPACPRRMDNARRIGRALAGETLKIMGENYNLAEDAEVAGCSRIMEIPYRDVSPVPVEEAKARWAYYQNHWDEFRQLDIEERSALAGTLRLDGYRQEGATGETVEIGAFALGDVFFVTNPAELFVEFQLDIKERFKGRKVIVAELTDGRVGYVPTRLACALGGYETIMTRFNPGTGELIRDVSCDLLAQLMG